MPGWRSTKEGRHFKIRKKLGISSDSNNTHSSHNSQSSSVHQSSHRRLPPALQHKKQELLNIENAIKEVEKDMAKAYDTLNSAIERTTKEIKKYDAPEDIELRKHLLMLLGTPHSKLLDAKPMDIHVSRDIEFAEDTLRSGSITLKFYEDKIKDVKHDIIEMSSEFLKNT